MSMKHIRLDIDDSGQVKGVGEKMISDAEIEELKLSIARSGSPLHSIHYSIVMKLLARLRSAEEILIGAFEVADIRGESGTCPPDCECWLHQARAHFDRIKP